MSIEVITPATKADWLSLRIQDITSTESAALFGLSPYMTEFELWHRKKDQRDGEFSENERMTWGTALEDSIANQIAKEESFEIRRMKEYIRDPETRMGSSFDFAIGADGLLEIKNVDSLIFHTEWVEKGDDREAPPHIEMQVQHQLAVSGRKFTKIGVLVGGNRGVLIHRDPQPQIIKAIRDKVSAFWKSIDDGVEPTPDFSRDYDTISRLYGHVEPGKVMDATPRIIELAAEYKAAQEKFKAAESTKKSSSAEMLSIMKDSEKVFGKDFSISSGMVADSPIAAYIRKGYRRFGIYFKKEKRA